MDLNPHPKVVDEINSFPSKHRKYVWNKLQKLKKDPIGDNTEVIRINGREVFRYKMKEERGSKDYRAVYDVEAQRIKLFAVFHRDQGYRKEEIARRF